MRNEAELRVTLDAPLPREIRVGSGTAVFVCGWCFSPAARIERLEFVLGGAAQPVSAMRMPRLDPFRELHPRLDPFATADLERDPGSAEDPRLNSYRSGFWGFVRLGPAESVDSPLGLELRAELAGGAVAIAPLGAITPVIDPPAPLPGRGDKAPAPLSRPEPLVAIAMATYNPPPALLHAQIESIRAQTHLNWVCVISDDRSRPERFAALRQEVGGDPRFILDRSPSRLGFLGNFERALRLVPSEAEFVALADQDDRWHPGKLRALLEAIGSHPLVYSDARVVDEAGNLHASTYWSRRRNNHSDLLSLFLANAVTGAASLLRADLLRDALPFPPAQFAHYHDHWLALVAASTGEIGFVSEPLYDYVQHGNAALGHATANRMPGLGERLRGLRERSLGARVKKWRMHYFVDLMRLVQCATILEMRLGDRLTPAGRRTVNQILGLERNPAALVRLAARGAGELHGRPETLGAEWMILGALLWRWGLRLSARERPSRRGRLDALPPTDLAPGPDRLESPTVAAVASIAAKISPLDLAVDVGRESRINLLVPTIDLDHFFGGYIGKFNLAAALQARGHRVRVVTVDRTPPLPSDWRRRLGEASGLHERLAGLEIAFARDGVLPVSPTDAFIATTWWSAHVAHDAVAVLGRERFLYLIQEYEPFTFPMGSLAALADASYGLPHRALFSTELLREFFRRRRIGVFAADPRRGSRDSLSFDNAITDFPAPTLEELAARPSRRLMFYARPEPHAARNMFELGMLGLARAAERGVLDGWELSGIGALAGGELAVGDRQMRMLPRLTPAEYGRVLREHDVGLSLMYTPHPSLVPIEMAAAGLVTVTNRFENKTPEALAGISRNLRAPEPKVSAIADALAEAVAASEDLPGRVAGSRVQWPRTWPEALPEGLLSQIEAMLEI